MPSTSALSCPLEVLNLLGQGPQDYLEVDGLQRRTHAQVARGERADTLIFTEMNSTYTAGRRTKPQDIPDSTLPVVEVDRGGSVTWHGPGQLVCYPIVRLREPVDVVAYVRGIERAVIAFLHDSFRLETSQVKGRSGVWVVREGQMDRKICAIGVRTALNVTMHGLALNVFPDLREFERIVPCGLADAGVTSLRDQGVALCDLHLSEIAAEATRYLAQYLEPVRIVGASELKERKPA